MSDARRKSRRRFAAARLSLRQAKDEARRLRAFDDARSEEIVDRVREERLDHAHEPEQAYPADH